MVLRVIDVCAVFEQNFCNLKADVLVLEYIDGLRHPREAVQQWCLIQAVSVVHVRAVFGQKLDYLVYATCTGCADGRETGFLRGEVYIDERVVEEILDDLRSAEEGGTGEGGDAVVEVCFRVRLFEVQVLIVQLHLLKPDDFVAVDQVEYLLTLNSVFLGRCIIVIRC